MVCLDTDVIVHFLRKNREVVELIEKIKLTGDQITTSVINEFELWKGIHRFKKKGREKYLKQFLSQIHKLDLDSNSSKKAAEIFEDLKRKGKLVDVLDIMIASIVITNKESLLTLNKKHFERIPGIRLI